MPSLKLFGTDGIRGKPGEFPLIPEFLTRMGAAFAQMDMANGRIAMGRAQKPFLLMARDTRSSGVAMAQSLCEGFEGAGWRVCDLGILPTPAVSYLVNAWGASLGCVISASHNPPEYNGVKFFSANGHKISRRWEEEIERRLLEEGAAWSRGLKAAKRPARSAHSLRGNFFSDRSSHHLNDLEGKNRYRDFLTTQVPPGMDLRGLAIVVDCAHGAASAILPELLRRLGARVNVLGDQPNGRNINVGCGALHPQELGARVRRHRADLGFALDGDADRLVVADEEGRVLPGEWVMATVALARSRLGEAGSWALVTTQVSNFALKHFLMKQGIEVMETPVGDRWVLEELLRHDLGFGGENSGHYIWRSILTSADGCLTAMMLAHMMKNAAKRASQFFVRFALMPQVTIQTPAFPAKPPLETLPIFLKELGLANRAMDQRGRVLVRYSGTEPILRILVEGSLGLPRLKAMAKNLEQSYRKALK
ncbi:MAG: phosphoglucosamine mutase [Elusimicrobia bacterium]|nr:phosphoglucosamine mutase [Elusimicrobiota bacterium]